MKPPIIVSASDAKTIGKIITPSPRFWHAKCPCCGQGIAVMAEGPKRSKSLKAVTVLIGKDGVIRFG